MLVCQRNTTVYVQSPPESRVCSGSEDKAAAHHDTRSDPRGPWLQGAPRCSQHCGGRVIVFLSTESFL